MVRERRFMGDAARAARADRFAARLAEMLHELKLTHKALAADLGVAHYTVDSWTRAVDAQLPGPANLQRLCALLDGRRPGWGRDLARLAGVEWNPAPPLPPPTPPGSGESVVSPASGGPGGATPPTNLPLALTSFVGREAELAALEGLLGETRLLTLLGPGGIGKTRLALELGRAVLPRYRDGVWLVELAAIQRGGAIPQGDADQNPVAQALAAALGLSEQGGQSISAVLASYLRERQALLILDNCEHLAAEVAAVVAGLLGSAPGLRVLATGQATLQVAGETVWRVAPLALPDPAATQPDLGAAAPRLFLDRARHHLPDWTPDADEARAVAALCVRLDGLPLALELAAACLPMLTAGQIAARLDDRFRLLTGGGRDVLPRHQTLHAAIAWSYSLLTEPESALFTRLAVFAGGWTLEAAEEVGAGEQGDVLALLKGLVDKSLVVVERPAGAARYRMLESIRAYAAEQLRAQGTEAAARAAHAAYFLRYAQAAAAAMYGPEQPLWQRRLDSEHDNVQAAITWAQAAGERELALRLGRALTLYWFFGGHFSEGRRLLEGLVEGAGSAPDLAALQCWALNGAGALACFQGDFARAGDLYRRSIALAAEIEDGENLAFALTGLSGVALYRNELARAVALVEESLARFRQYANQWNIGLAISNLIPALLAGGQLERARALAEERRAIYEGLGNPWGIATSYTHLGLVAAAQGDYSQAAAFYREGLAQFGAWGDKWGSYECLAGLAVAVAAQGRARQAVRLFGATEALRAALGAIAPPAYYNYAAVVEGVRATLDPNTWEAEWQVGRHTTLSETLETTEIDQA